MKSGVVSASERRTLGGAAGCAAVAIVLFLVLSFFVAPQADDFCFAVYSRETGVLANAIHYYETWSGRFSTLFLMGLPYQLGELAGLSLTGAYRTSALIMLVATVGALAVIARLILPAWPARERWLLTLLFCFVVIANLRSPVGYVYWVTGGLVHGMTALAAASVVAVVHAAASGIVRIGLAGIGGLALLALAAANGSELVGGCIVIMTAVVWVARPAGRRAVWPLVIVVCAAALAGTLAAVLAPGNTTRIAYNEGAGFVGALLITPVNYVVYLLLRLDTYGFMAWLALVGMLAARTGPADEGAMSGGWTGWLAHRRLAIAMVAGWVLCGGFTFFVGAYALGTGIPARAQNLLSLIGAVALTIAAIDIGRRDGRRIGAWLEARLPARLVRNAVAAAVVVMLLSLQAVYAVIDLSGPAQWFALEHATREAVLEAADGGAVAVPAYAHHPRLLYFADIVDENEPGKLWINECVARYYGLESVSLAPAP